MKWVCHFKENKSYYLTQNWKFLNQNENFKTTCMCHSALDRLSKPKQFLDDISDDIDCNVLILYNEICKNMETCITQWNNIFKLIHAFYKAIRG